MEAEDESRLRDSPIPSVQTDPLFHQPLPLTPPPVPREDTTRSVVMRADSNTLPSPIPLTSPGLGTPIGQRSPPTPENTPPAKKAHQSSLSRPQIFRQGSSRAESFKTAREDFSSDDDEEVVSHTPLAKYTPSRQNWTEELDLGLSRKVGLGLGLESDDEDKTPTAQTPRVIPETWSFNTFDGAWSHSTEAVNEDPMVASAPVPMSPIDISQQFDQDNQTPPVLPSDPASPSNQTDLPIGRNLSLRERVEKTRSSPISLSTEHFAEQIQWPMDIEQADIDAKVRQVDNKRLSQMSATSTVVEAMVLETPPQRRRTLRHTGKNASLRTASSPISGSNRSSLISDEIRHRLVHRNIRIIERGNRTSLTLDSLPSTGSDPTLPQRQPAPTPVIPQRRSSLKSSAANSKRHSMSHSSNEPNQSSRPTTAPTAATSYFDVPRRQVRTMSGTLESPILSRLQDMMPNNPPLVIPARSSSLSAPTSREASRTTSLTSTSHRRQESEQITQPSAPPPVVDLVARPSTPSEQDDDVMTDIKDLSGLRPRSALVTPFSMASMNSSTPGTLEVSEATAVNIYPHNNRSILLVEQLARSNPDGQEASTILPEGANFTLTRPPEEVLSGVPPRLTHSPLRHPRAPPQPPNFKVIPPTPADRTPVIEADRQLGQSSPDAMSPGRFAKVRRALSARRYSESFVSPLRSLSKRHTITASRRTTAADPASKLSPFWRPRAFWDDLSESESELGTDGHFVANTSGTPKRTVSGPSALSRRLGSLKLRRHRPAETFQSVRRTFSDDSIHSYAFITTGKKLGSIPRLGYQIHFVGFRGLQDMYEKRKVRKEEDRREKERLRLRRSIGPVLVREDASVY
ncbi:hypothetical protein MMC18_002794 [Xylographa bjoerkii]|nr:hypothetical protein [Xylographa bjoerkii]